MAFATGMKITHDDTKAFRQLIAELGRTEVLVGVPSDGEQPHRGVGTVGSTARTETSAVNNAELAYIHDNGAPEANIPARPFMIPGMEKVAASVEAHLKSATVGLLAEDRHLFEQGIAMAGNTAVDGIRKTLDDGVPPPLSPRTLAGRRARGNTSTTPLIDTRQLYNSISFVIRRT